MAKESLPVLTESELETVCACNGTAPCGDAQADGVPCSSLGRPCEFCGQAAVYLREVEAARAETAAAKATADDPELDIVPTEIGA